MRIIYVNTYDSFPLTSPVLLVRMATTAKLPWTYKQNTFQTSERLERKDRNHLIDYFIEYEASLRNNRCMFNPTYRREHLDYME